MEDEDFGFTRRDDKVLERAISNDKITEDQRDTKIEGEGKNKGNEISSPTSKGVVKVLPETGSCSDKLSLKPSVSFEQEKVNIPNVVEYHLKVKPDQSGNNKDLPSVLKLQENMRKEQQPHVNQEEQWKKEKDITRKLAKLSVDNNVFEGSNDLPQVFQVKYLGCQDARGLWGIKHTRKPVDVMVSAAKSLPSNSILPLIKLVVSIEGVALLPFRKHQGDEFSSRLYPIETISYGVQDLVYTRVFSMIVVRESENFRRVSPFECHGFVCESKHHARQLTYALAAAFQIYSQNARTISEKKQDTKRFAIDLRSPEEIEADLAQDSEA